MGKYQKSLRACIAEAQEKGVAIGHFNISNLEALHGIYNAAKKLNVPVIIGVSEGERDFVGVKEAAALVSALRNGDDYPIYLNADHTYTFERVKEAIDAGFDAVIFDGAKLSLEENIQETRKCVDYAKNCGRDVIVEGELGYIGQSSKILDSIPDGAAMTEDMMTKPEDAAKFVRETGVDLLAPAVGNIHGMLKGGIDPALNTKLVENIRQTADVPLVLHGASGNSADDIRATIKNGVSIVHINTELRVAFVNALRKAVAEKPDEVAPYKLLADTIDAVEKVAEEKLKIFNFID